MNERQGRLPPVVTVPGRVRLIVVVHYAISYDRVVQLLRAASSEIPDRMETLMAGAPEEDSQHLSGPLTRLRAAG